MNGIAESLVAAQPAPAAPPRPLTASRVAGSLLMLFWIAAAIGLVIYLYLAWDIDKIERYGPKFLSGLYVTLTLVGVSIVVGALISFPVALGRMSKNIIISRLAFAYVYIFRGTPLIAQLFLIYYGLGSFRHQLEAVGLWGFFRDAWNCALFGECILKKHLQGFPAASTQAG